MFDKVLVANRGEIALRIIRACRELGIRSVAVYSEADRTALHVRWADEAYCIGPPPAAESYLKVEAILAAARKAGARAVHPGYGFLAENGDFADACEEAGLTFIGPTGAVIRAMGDKIEARRLMREAGVPVMPGSGDAVASPEALEREAERIGFPVMIKASGGGGGKGIRIVESPGELRRAFDMARSEAEKAFGNPAVYVEKYLRNPRHIEFQVLADHRGNVVHLGERECSIQRRHQKIIEESPSPVMTPSLREEMGAVAVRACRAIGYRNAGTVEFLVEEGNRFYFLEMNTRLQVEHPVTEEVTGLDLVKLQLRVAAGEPLPVSQDAVKLEGHAVEARVYAEDPDRGFLPAVGKVMHLDLPGGTRVRVDSGLYAGMEVSLYYDPMLAKLVVSGEDRGESIARLKRALGEFHVSGVKTNIPFLRAVLEQEDFREGCYHTGYVEEHLDRILSWEGPERLEDVAVIAAAVAHRLRLDAARKLGARRAPSGGGWAASFRPRRGGGVP